MGLVKKIVEGFHVVLIFMAKVLIVLMTILTCIQVFYRYFTDYSIKWSEEVPLILMVWFGFISMAMGVKKKLHISIELFYRMFPKRMQKVIVKFVDLCIFVFGVIMIVYGWQLSQFFMTSTMPVTKMPSGFLYGIVPITGIMVAYDSLMNLLGLGEEEREEDQNEVVLGGDL